MKRRLDEILVARGLAESRTQAKALIMSGSVQRGTESAWTSRAGNSTPGDAISVASPPRFVSRGGEKLAGGPESASRST
jgi:23S rRNA (cytidine1920-2'-O)/16S rRNA (cytidine1409-2'-O)-methyltransferase